MFLGFPVWWLSGIGDVIFVLGAAIMGMLLIRRGHIQAPRGFGIWMFFLLWMLCSVIGIDTGGRLVGFIYRALLYLAVTVIFLYVYNGRSTITPRNVLGVLTGFWLVVVAGGYLGIFFPLLTVTTPLSYVLPDFLLSNELVQEMVVRRATQYNPDSWLSLDPRPSAPFLYTNGWGNAYSLMMPIVIAYTALVRRERKFWWLVVAIVISVVPALLTLNRGMFIGLGIGLAYVALRWLIAGRFRAFFALLAVGVVVLAAFFLSPAQERLTNRLDESSTTEDRANLYDETFQRTLESPLFGYGAPRPSAVEGAPSAGTQGQFWMVMFSHGFPAVIAFTGWLLWVFVRSISRRDPVGLACNTVLLVISVETLYYGVTTSGLPIAMAVAAILIGGQPKVRRGPIEPIKLADSTRGDAAVRTMEAVRPRTQQ